VDRFSADIETNLIDLRDIPLDKLQSCDPGVLAPIMAEIHRQLDGLRFNLGSTGPPGRVD
jgi:hypothetical protein